MKEIFTFLALCLIFTNGLTAEVTIGNDELNMGAILITGEIKKGDFEKIRSVTKHYIRRMVKDENNHLQYILNSTGGDVKEAVKIGLLFRDSLARVYVWGNRLIHESEKEAQTILNARTMGGVSEALTQTSVIYSDKRPLTKDDFKKCYSACVLMFLGGIQKTVSDNHYWIDGVRADEKLDVPVIGIHRPYFIQDKYAELSITEAKSSYKRLKRFVNEYLEEIGATRDLIDRMFKSSSNEIDLIHDSDFRGMINKIEPFYSEWIIAKCGVHDNGEKLLSASEYNYKKDVFEAKKKEVRRLIGIHGGGIEDYNHIYLDYIPDNYSREKFDKIVSTVRSHNNKVRKCTEYAVKRHQIDMFAE